VADFIFSLGFVKEATQVWWQAFYQIWWVVKIRGSGRNNSQNDRYIELPLVPFKLGDIQRCIKTLFLFFQRFI